MNTLGSPRIEIVIPVYNEEAQLAATIDTLRGFLARVAEIESFTWRLTIADNASTDRTLAIASNLAATYPEVAVAHLDRKGRGRALRQTWLNSEADVVAYMDVDLSTDLEAFLPLVRPLLAGTSDIAIGSRLARGARVKRSLKREIISRGYNLLIHSLFGRRFSDAQCGFKAARTTVARQLVPLVHDNAWFWDTELLLLASERGFRISEVPVRWVEDSDTRVKLGSTIWEDLKGLARMRLAFWSATLSHRWLGRVAHR